MIKGVAGSGKTLVLLSRAKLIGESRPDWRVLLTCFNRVLALELAQQIAGVANVTVKNIDRLPYDLKEETKRRPTPFWFDSNVDCYSSEDYNRRIELCVKYLRKYPKAGMYDIVLVDQGEDFNLRRLEFAYRLLKPERKDFIVARDAAQNVRRGPEWLPPGTSEECRTKILRTNYRNTREVFYLAFNFLMMGEGGNTDEIIEPAAPLIHGKLRRGPVPGIINVRRDAEVGAVCYRLSELGKRGVRWDAIAVLCGNYEIQAEYETQMRRMRIPCLNLAKKDQRDRAAETENCVLVASLIILKGLQFPHVFLTGLEDITVPETENDDTIIRRFLYAAITRSTRYLTIVASCEKPYLRDIQKLIQEVRDRTARRQ